MPDPPKVSVIIPHFNMHDFLPAAVRSVDRQNYDNIELIVVDDGSDHSLDINQIDLDKSWTNDIEFTLLQIEHGGKSKAVNKGFLEATGDYLAILDADDQLPEDSISSRMKEIRRTEADLCLGSFECYANGEVQSKREIENFTALSNKEIIRRLLSRVIAPFHQNAMLFSRHLLRRVGPMDPKMLRSQDKDFAIRLLKESNKTSIVPNSVYRYYRYHRPLRRRLLNRLVGLKYQLWVIRRYSLGWRTPVYLMWGVLVGSAKLVHDFFGVYKG